MANAGDSARNPWSSELSTPIIAESWVQIRIRGTRMDFASSEGYTPKFCNSAFACPRTPSSSKPSFAARCQICTSLNRAPSLPCAVIGEMGLRYACNFHTLLLYVPDSMDNNVPCIRPTTGKTFPAPRLHLNPSDPARCPSTENEQNCPGI